MKHSHSTVWIQRLGYILARLEIESSKKQALLQVISSHLQPYTLQPVALTPEISIKDAPRDKTWMIIENTTIESDI